MKQMVLGLVTICAASGVAAECPVAADLEAGIRFHVDQGDTETFRQKQPAVVEAIYQYEDGTRYRNLLAQGVYLLEWVDLVDGVPDTSARTVYAFQHLPKDLPIPVAGQSVTLGVLISGGGSMDQEMQTYRFLDQTEVTLGDCTYDMIPIDITYMPDNGNGTDRLNYLPELKISYFVSSTAGSEIDRYDYHGIEAVR